jgi:hypothetical protein
MLGRFCHAAAIAGHLKIPATPLAPVRPPRPGNCTRQWREGVPHSSLALAGWSALWGDALVPPGGGQAATGQGVATQAVAEQPGSTDSSGGGGGGGGGGSGGGNGSGSGNGGGGEASARNGGGGRQLRTEAAAEGAEEVESRDSALLGAGGSRAQELIEDEEAETVLYLLGPPSAQEQAEGAAVLRALGLAAPSAGALFAGVAHGVAKGRGLVPGRTLAACYPCGGC